MHICHDDNAQNIFKLSAFKLKDCVQVLEVLSASTEDQFLDIGSRLTSIYERAAKVSELSGTIVDLMSGRDITETIEGLTALMEGLEVHLKNIDSLIGESITKMTSISDRMENIEWDIEDMDRITKLLNGLGFCTRLQNAILKKPVESIRVLGQGVKKLSSDITEKSDHIERATKSLTKVVCGSREKIDKLSSIQKNKEVKIIKSIISDIDSLNNKYSSSASLADEISECSGETSQSIREIVTFIQFHDITRQQFERSRNAFINMTEILEGVSEKDDLGETARLLAEFCVREGAPLHNTQSDFVSVVMAVIENLNALSESVKKLLMDVGLLVGTGSSIENSSLETIEKSLFSVASTISTFSETGMMKGELSDATALVTNTIGEMSGFVRDIENIGEEIELIALNATISASQIGEDGRALGIVAEEIQKISTQAQLRTAAIAGILKDVGSTAEELSADVKTGEKNYIMKITGISEELDRHVGYLRNMNRELISAIRNIDETGRGLVDEVVGVTANITINKEVEFVVGGAISNLRDIFSDIHLRFPEIAKAGEAHLSLSPQTYDLILADEIKMMQSVEKMSTVGTRSEDLGDNVELFL